METQRYRDHQKLNSESNTNNFIYQDEPLDLSIRDKDGDVIQGDPMITSMMDPITIAQFHGQFLANLLMMHHIGAQETFVEPTVPPPTPPPSPVAAASVGKEKKKKKFLNARMASKLSPYMINRLEQKGILNQLDEEDVLTLPYNPRKVRNFEKCSPRTEQQQNRRDKNNLAGRQSRYKVKLIEEVIKQEASVVEHENIMVKTHLAKLRVYANYLLIESGKNPVNWSNAFKMEMLQQNLLGGETDTESEMNDQ